MEPKKLTSDDLRAIRARAEAATPGPWLWYDDKLRTSDPSGKYQVDKTVLTYGDPNGGLDPDWEWGVHAPHEADAEFIAAARVDIPALLAHADALAHTEEMVVACYERVYGHAPAAPHDAVAALMNRGDMLQTERDALAARVEALETALRGISMRAMGTTAHPTDYGQGMIEGMKICGDDARRALEGGNDD